MAGLLLAVILVHAFYLTVVRPEAQRFLEQETANKQHDPLDVQQQSFFAALPRGGFIGRDMQCTYTFAFMWAHGI